MKSVKYLELIKQKKCLRSNYQLAQVLGVNKVTIYYYLRGTNTMSNGVCIKVANLLEIDPAEVIFAAEEDRRTKKLEKAREQIEELKNLKF